MRREFQGQTTEGTNENVRLTIGLRADRPRRGSLVQRKGTIIDSNRAREEIYRLRAGQVGRKAAAATLTRCHGLWLGKGEEPTIQCEIEFVPTPREQRLQTFRRHMGQLAEQAALLFGQQEVWLRMAVNSSEPTRLTRRDRHPSAQAEGS